MLYDEINYILYIRKPVKILDLNGFIIYLYYYINRLLSKNYITKHVYCLCILCGYISNNFKTL